MKTKKIRRVTESEEERKGWKKGDREGGKWKGYGRKRKKGMERRWQ